MRGTQTRHCSPRGLRRSAIANNPFYRSRFWRKLRRAALERDHWRCTIAGCIEPATVADHIVARPRGLTEPCPADRLENLRSLCETHDKQIKEAPRQARPRRSRGHQRLRRRRLALGEDPMTASTTLTVTVAPRGAPIAIVLAAVASIPDNSPAGFVVATATVKTSDGSPFTGALALAGDPIFAVEGMQVVLARALTSADDGTRYAMVTAMHPTNPVTARLALG
jgi:hypothetical protein